ncbi:MAG TPA: GEVED domain-containing protein, partial [Flavobacterium sp.]|nr:GEVED domain-containing protein [Flavobacterium sp.]
MNVNYNWRMSNRLSANQKSKQSEIECKKRSFSQPTNWLLMALLLMFSFSFAQTIQLGTGTSTNSNVPINYNWGYNYTQTIYTAAEMTAAGASATGTITSIKFKPTSSVSTALWKDWVVYIGNTSKDGFTSTTDWIPLASLTEVFNGTLIANTVANSWMEITLATPFNWTGGNLVVAIDENTASYGGNPNWASYTLAPTTGNKSIYYRNDSTNPSPSTPPTASSRSNVVAQIQFVFPSVTVPNCAISHAPAAAATGVARNATLSWADGGGGPTSYDVYFGTSTSPALVGNQVGTSYTPSLMAANTSYYWRVVPKNANGEAVGGCTERSFTTGTGYNYCSVSVTNTGDYTSAFSTTLATTNISYTAGSNPADSYTDQTAQSFQVGQGTSFNFSHTYVGGSNGVKAWVDYNSDGTFGAGEDVYFLADSNATKNGTITVPLGTPLGTYRMRVRSQFGSTAEPTACGNLSYGTTMDYTLTVIAPPSCLAPSALASSAVTASSATLSWTASASSPANGYDIYYSTTNTAPLAGTTPTVDNHTASPYNVSGLTSATTYYWWVRSDCGAETSAWASG